MGITPGRSSNDHYSFVDTDICNIGVDAIVLPANESLKEGSGASTALFQAAGRNELTRACEKIGHCDVGSAVVTDAFNLNAQFIIHACVPKWVDGDHGEYKLLCSMDIKSAASHVCIYNMYSLRYLRWFLQYDR